MALGEVALSNPSLSAFISQVVSGLVVVVVCFLCPVMFLLRNVLSSRCR